MVASQAEMQGGPAAIVEEMVTEIEAAAEQQEWDRVEEIALKVRYALLQVAEAERREIVLEVRRSLDRVRELAEQARSDVTERLSALRRGRDAARAYGNAGPDTLAELR